MKMTYRGEPKEGLIGKDGRTLTVLPGGLKDPPPKKRPGDKGRINPFGGKSCQLKPVGPSPEARVAEPEKLLTPEEARVDAQQHPDKRSWWLVTVECTNQEDQAEDVVEARLKCEKLGVEIHTVTGALTPVGSPDGPVPAWFKVTATDEQIRLVIDGDGNWLSAKPTNAPKGYEYLLKKREA
jgi:hypothetical protein